MLERAFLHKYLELAELVYMGINLATKSKESSCDNNHKNVPRSSSIFLKIVFAITCGFCAECRCWQEYFLTDVGILSYYLYLICVCFRSGVGCHVCGSDEHKRRDCPDLKALLPPSKKSRKNKAETVARKKTSKPKKGRQK